jgi:bifunctional non-homologous end joining protein LigD
MAAARDITTRVGHRTLTLTNLDKVLYPSVGFTKAEVIDYYARIAPDQAAFPGRGGRRQVLLL